MTIKDTQFQMNLFNFDFDSLAAWNYYHCDFYAFKNHVIFKIVKLNWLTVHLNLLGNKIQPFNNVFCKISSVVSFHGAIMDKFDQIPHFIFQFLR